MPLEINGKTFYHVFTAGKYPQGDVSTEQLSEIARTYDPTNVHEAPVWLGHPDTKKDAGNDEPQALGWVDSLMVQGNKLYASFSYISEEWKKYAEDQKYKYVSIDLGLDEDTPYYLYAIGLTNREAVRGMEPIVFKDHKFKSDFTRRIQLTKDLSNSFNSNNFKPKKFMNEHLKKFAALLGVDASKYTEDEALYNACNEKFTAMKDENETMKGKMTDTRTDNKEYTELQNDLKEIKKQRNEAMVESAIDAGKIEPAQKDAILRYANADFDGCKSFLGGIKVSKQFTQNAVNDDPTKRVDLADPKFKDEKGVERIYTDVIKDPAIKMKFTSEELAELKKKDPRFAGKTFVAPVVVKKK